MWKDSACANRLVGHSSGYHHEEEGDLQRRLQTFYVDACKVKFFVVLYGAHAGFNIVMYASNDLDSRDHLSDLLISPSMVPALYQTTLQDLDDLVQSFAVRP